MTRIGLNDGHKAFLCILAGIMFVLFGCRPHFTSAPEEHFCSKTVWDFSTGDEDTVTAPVVADGAVYFGSASGTVFALDAGSGEQMWRYEAGAAVNAAPVVVDGILYVSSGDGQLQALDAVGGERLWRSTTGGDMGFPPAVNDGAVYVASTDGYLYAFEAASGNLLWRFESGAVAHSSLAGGEGAVYFASADGHLHAVAASNGKLLWRFEAGGGVTTSPTAANGVVFVGSSDGHLYAVNAANGEQLWRFHLPVAAPPFLAPPSVVGDIVYYSAQGHDVYAVDARSGELLWQRVMIEEAMFPPLVADGKAFVGTYFGSAYQLNVFDALTGKLVAQIQILGEGTATYPAAADGMVYAGIEDGMLALEFPFAAPSEAREIVPKVFLENSTSGPPSQNSAVHFLENSFIAEDGRLVHIDSVSNEVSAFDGVTGDTIWCNRLISDYFQDFSGVLGVTDSVVYIAKSAGFLVALDTTAGHKLWQTRLFYPNPYMAQATSIAIHDSVLYVVSDGLVAAFDADSGKVIWQASGREMDAHDRPAYVAGALYISSRDSIEVLDASSGEPLRRLDVGERVVSSPVVADGMLYIASEDGVRAVDSTSGELRWRHDNQYIQDVFLQVIDGLLIIGAYDEVFALDASTGTMRWHMDNTGPIYLPPVIAAGVVYFPSGPRSLYALDARTGAVRWHHRSPDRIYSGSRVVAVVDGTVYFAAHGELYALDAASGGTGRRKAASAGQSAAALNRRVNR